MIGRLFRYRPSQQLDLFQHLSLPEPLLDESVLFIGMLGQHTCLVLAACGTCVVPAAYLETWQVTTKKEMS